MIRRLTWPAVAAFVAAAAGYLCFPVVMGEWLSWGGGAENLRRAVAWVDRDGAHWCRLAEAEETDEAAKRAFTRCTEAHPAWGMAWTSLGLLTDAMGGDGERALREGAKWNRRYGAYRALADHYFARGRWQEFESWAREGLLTGSETGRMELLEMLLATPGGEDRDLLAEAKGEPVVVKAVLELAMGRGWEGVAKRSVAQLPGEAWRGARERWEEWLLGRGQGAELEGRGRIWNERFTPWPTGKGRDWRMGGGPGVEVVPEFDREGMRVSLSGQQAEEATVAWTYVDLEGGEMLETWAERRGGGGDSGLRWRLEEVKTGRTVWEAREALGGLVRERMVSSGWAGGTARLILGYRRKRGTVRWSGEVVVRRVWLP